MFGSKKSKKVDEEKEELRSENDTLHRQLRFSRGIGFSIMGYSNDKTDIQNCLYSEGPIESCAYLSSPSGPPGLLYHHCEDEEAELFFVGDVAGRGNSAALIATYLKGIIEKAASSYKISGGTSWIGSTLMEMNQWLVEKQLFGRFVAINVILIWKESGTVYLWGMGGSAIHLFRKDSGELKSYSINSTPALGVFDSDMLEMQGAPSSFGPKRVSLGKEDCLLLIDDGFEESNRPKTNGNETGEENGEEEDEWEEFGEERVREVLHATLTGGSARIPGPDNRFHWNIQMENAPVTTWRTVAILAAAEKLFRLKPLETKSSDAPALVSTEMLEILNEIVESDEFSSEEDGGRELKLMGYTELPQQDDQFALAIHMT